eukprot:7393339-Pyramimonas_sp.AAC.1
MMWNLLCLQEWSAWEVAFSPDTIRTWIFSDEQLADAGHSALSDEEKALITRRMWTDDGRYICKRYHAVRA